MSTSTRKGRLHPGKGGGGGGGREIGLAIFSVHFQFSVTMIATQSGNHWQAKLRMRVVRRSVDRRKKKEEKRRKIGCPVLTSASDWTLC